MTTDEYITTLNPKRNIHQKNNHYYNSTCSPVMCVQWSDYPRTHTPMTISFSCTWAYFGAQRIPNCRKSSSFRVSQNQVQIFSICDTVQVPNKISSRLTSVKVDCFGTHARENRLTTERMPDGTSFYTYLILFYTDDINCRFSLFPRGSVCVFLRPHYENPSTREEDDKQN